MAGFCDADDVRAKNPHRTYDTDSTPTLVQVNGYIDDRASDLRAILRQHTIDESNLDANALAWLLDKNATGAAWNAEQNAQSVGIGTPTDHVRNLREEWFFWIGQLRENSGLLQTSDSRVNRLRSRTENIGSNARDYGTDPGNESIQPRVTMDEDN